MTMLVDGVWFIAVVGHCSAIVLGIIDAYHEFDFYSEGEEK